MKYRDACSTRLPGLQRSSHIHIQWPQSKFKIIIIISWNVKQHRGELYFEKKNRHKKWDNGLCGFSVVEEQQDRKNNRRAGPMLQTWWLKLSNVTRNKSTCDLLGNVFVETDIWSYFHIFIQESVISFEGRIYLLHVQILWCYLSGPFPRSQIYSAHT